MKTSSIARQLSRTRFFLRHKRELWATILGAAWTIISPFITGFSYWILPGAFLTVIGILFYRKSVVLAQQNVVDTPTSISASVPTGTISFATVERIWHFYPDVNTYMRRHGLNNKTTVKRSFSIPDRAIAIAPYLLNAVYASAFNETKIRLSSPPQDLLDYKKPVALHATDYYSYLCTCRATGHEIRIKDTTVYDGKDMIVQNGAYLDYSSCEAAHHIGVSCLILTSDGKLILQEQFMNNNTSQGHVVPSGSGSLDRSDVKDKDTFEVSLIAGCLREAEEELGIVKGKWPPMQTLLLGMAIDPTRGLVTDFFAMIRLDEAYSLFKDRFSEKRSDGRQRPVAPQHLDLSSQASALVCIDNVINSIKPRKSDVLHVALHLLQEAVRDDEVWTKLSKS